MKKEEEELLMIITAAAAAALGYKVKVNKISFLSNPNEAKKSGWTLIGRLDNLKTFNPVLKGN